MPSQLLMLLKSSSVSVGVPLTLPDYVFFDVMMNNPSNITETVNETFTSANVDTATNEIDFGVDMKFLAHTSNASAKGTLIEVSATTGTLPDPLVIGDKVYLSPTTGTKYKAYKVATAADMLTLTHALESENPMPAQNFVQRENEVNFTSQGTGTHTVTSEELLIEMRNLVSGSDRSNYVAKCKDEDDRHTMFPLETDAQSDVSHRSFNLMRDPEDDGSYDLHGRIMDLDVINGTSRLTFKSEMANKRFLVTSFLVDVNDYAVNGNIKHFIDQATDIDSVDNEITATSHRFNGLGKSDRVRIINHAGTLDSALSEDTDYYVSEPDSNTLQLHALESDADTPTNPVSLNGDGTGTFTIYAPDTVPDLNRQSFFAEILEVGGASNNAITPQMLNVPPNQKKLLDERDFNLNGRIGRSGRAIQEWVDGEIDGVIAMNFVYSPESTRPVRTDTGLAIEDGVVWVTEDPDSSVFARLHKSEQDALDSVGVSTASIPAGEVITFTSIGEFQVFPRMDNQTLIEIGYGNTSNLQVTANEYLALGQGKQVLTFEVDYNNPAETNVIIKIYVNTILLDTIDTGTSKGATPAAIEAAVGTVMNSAAAHVTLYGRLYGFCIGASNDDIDILDLINYQITRITLGNDNDIAVVVPVVGTPPSLSSPVNTAIPTISGTAQSGETLSATSGTWTGNPTPTYTYQWQDDGVDISGATSTTYLLTDTEIGGVITVEVTATNSEGLATAESAGTSAVIAAAPPSSIMPEIFSIDARDASSYGGTGTTVSNTIASPDDGAAQTAYDFTLNGGMSFVDGNPDYFEYDGDGLIQIGANTQFVKDMMKTTGGEAWTMAFDFNLGDTASNQMLASNRTSSSAFGFDIQVSSSGAVTLFSGDGSSNNFYQASLGVTALTRNVLIISYDPSTLAVTFWLNSDTVSDTGNVSTHTAIGEPSQLLTIGARSNGGSDINDGGRQYGGRLYSGVADNANAAAIRAELDALDATG